MSKKLKHTVITKCANVEYIHEEYLRKSLAVD
jgi:hypothetical protein